MQRLQFQRIDKNSHQKILVTDNSKFGKSKLYKICDLKDFQYIITNKKMEEKEKKYAEEHNVKWIIS